MSWNSRGAMAAVGTALFLVLLAAMAIHQGTAPAQQESQYKTKTGELGAYIDLAGDANWNGIFLDDPAPGDIAGLRAWNTKAFPLPETNEIRWRVYQNRVHFFDGEKWVDLNRMSYPAIEKAEFILEEKPQATNPKTAFSSPEQPFVCFGSDCIAVELARSQQEISNGLMFREQLPENAGMLFVFPEESPRSFWMKNTLIPLDIVWLDSTQKIIFIKENAQPCTTETCESFAPSAPALFVLEANTGFAQENKLAVGQKAEFENVFAQEIETKTIQISTTRFKIANYLLHQGIAASVNRSNEVVLSDAKGDEIKRLAPAFAVDSNNNFAPAQYNLLQKKQKLEIFVDINAEWLNNAAYPVLIDPDANYLSAKADGYLTKASAASYATAQTVTPTVDNTSTTIAVGQKCSGPC